MDEAERTKVVGEALRVIGNDGAAVFLEPRQETLEKLWKTDPDHPLAADPSLYLENNRVREQLIEGRMMDVILYRKAA